MVNCSHCGLVEPVYHGKIRICPLCRRPLPKTLEERFMEARENKSQKPIEKHDKIPDGQLELSLDT